MSTEEVYVTSSEEWSQKATITLTPSSEEWSEEWSQEATSSWSQKATITLTPSSEEWSGEAAITFTPGCLAEPEANHHGPAQNADQPTQ